MTPAAARKHFTVEEASRRLPLVRAIVGDIVDLYRDVRERQERLDRVRKLPGASQRDEESVYGEELRQSEAEIEKDVERLYGFVAELHELGVELKDRAIGLVDFPTLINGREAYLCWKLGEEDIAYWHELDAGFPGRQSLLQTSDFTGDEESQPR